ncbi:MAG TPA: NACHT domain-containing protein [Chloroflexia bacterium]
MGAGAYGDLIDKIDWEDSSREEWRLELVGLLARQGKQVLVGFLLDLEQAHTSARYDLGVEDREEALRLAQEIKNLDPAAYEVAFAGVLNQESTREMIRQIRDRWIDEDNSYTTNSAFRPCEPPLPLFVDAQVAPGTGEAEAEADYVIAVGQAFADWIDLDAHGRIAPESIPGRLLGTEVIYRRVTSQQKEQGMKLWSTCDLSTQSAQLYRVLVLGRSGIGKTSLMKMLARQCADAYKGRVLPIVVSLRNWAGTDEESLVSYIADFLKNPPDYDSFPDGSSLADHLPDYLREKSKERRLMFFFDDYDRMLARDPETRPQRVAAMQSFLNRHKQSIVLVFCRSMIYDGSLNECRPRFSVVEMNPWMPAQIKQYLRLNAPSLARFADNPRLWDIGDIPYQLKIAVDLSGREPEKLSGLLGGLGELMRSFVDRVYSDRVSAGEWNATMPGALQAVLTRVASAMLRTQVKPGTYLSYDEARREAEAAVATPDPDRVLLAGGEASLLDLLPDRQGLAFEAQQLESYFQSLALSEGDAQGSFASQAEAVDTMVNQLNSDVLDPLRVAPAIALGNGRS